jgi:shikimate dehydrogenase
MNKPTLQCGVVLHPAAHTRSPAMHNAAYQRLGIDATYAAYDIPPEALAEAMQKFRKQGLRQLAVSIPHKQAMMELVDEVEAVGRAIGAINTVTRVDDRFVGTNTDWLGAIRALERATKVDGQRAVVLGAGGAARALVYGLRSRGCDVYVLNRTLAHAETLVSELGASGAGRLSELAELSPEIIVNATSVGLNEPISPVAAEGIPAGSVVLDAVYSPAETRLLSDAKDRGARPVGGKWMLVYQAAEQLRLFTAQLDDPPADSELVTTVDIMAEAFERNV